MDTLPANDAKTIEPPAAAAAPECAAEVAAGLAAGDGVEPGYVLLPETLLRELWLKAGARQLDVSEAEFGAALEAIGARQNFGLEPGRQPGARERETFWRGLRLDELALAQGCARGRETAWQQFIIRFRSQLSKAAVGLTRSAALGEELASTMLGELYGLAEREGARKSPLERYSGRGSLMGWLRAMMVQQQVNQYRKTYRETALEDLEPEAPEYFEPEPRVLAELRRALPVALAELAGEERFLLSAYYLDEHTLLEIGRALRVHEATVSRKLKRAAGHVHKELLRALTARGLNRRAAEEALGTDPRYLDMNLRKLLQTPESRTYSDIEGRE